MVTSPAGASPIEITHIKAAGSLLVVLNGVVVLVTPDAHPSPFMLWGWGVYSGGADWRVVLVTPDACPSPFMLWGCGV